MVSILSDLFTDISEKLVQYPTDSFIPAYPVKIPLAELCVLPKKTKNESKS